MQFDFKSEMEKRTDEDLVKILTVDQENYMPEALIAANDEFVKRKLSIENFAHLSNVVLKKKEAELKKAAVPLDDAIKVITLLFPMIITFIFSGFYKAEGYERKAKELVRWTVYGFFLYLILTAIILATDT